LAFIRFFSDIGNSFMLDIWKTILDIRKSILHIHNTAFVFPDIPKDILEISEITISDI